jgi:hypothetical protein
MKRMEKIEIQTKMRIFVAVLWVREQLKQRMKAKNLNKIEMYKVHINPALDRYLEMPLFQSKIDEGNQLLAQVGLPKEFAGRF